MSKEFITAVEETFDPEVDQGAELTLDGRELRYFRPTDGQIAIYMASSSKHSTVNDKVAATINFFMGLFEEDDQSWLAGRLMDRDDAFGVTMVQTLLNSMLEDWSGRPTKSSGGSTQSRKSAGRKSTAPTRALTSSPSPSIAS